ncbi:MAG: nucleotidyltransferase domain-containing protein [Clostridiales bacterium]|nr:nucleotidyltransferase domain-containing protein [Clostridiales bacterium]
MNTNQRRYIEYAREFARTRRCHIWLGGSFLRGNPTPFSDVDISVLCDTDTLSDLIEGYGKTIYLSSTVNPEGILIVIYEDGVALDLEVIEDIDATCEEFFHEEDIRDRSHTRNSLICQEICTRKDLPYQMSRLFHRSLIKYLAGKKDAGLGVANEIVEYIDSGLYITESDYKDKITLLIEKFNDRYPLDEDYRLLLSKLADQI